MKDGDKWTHRVHVVDAVHRDVARLLNDIACRRESAMFREQCVVVPMVCLEGGCHVSEELVLCKRKG